MIHKIKLKIVSVKLKHLRINIPVLMRFLHWKHIAIGCFLVITFSCKKEDSISTTSENIKWIRVLEDSLLFSTDDEMYLGTNGKVITDPDDNIYVYYYSKDLDQAVVRKFDSEGTPVWKKLFDNCKPLDMVRLNDGNIILATSITKQLPNYLTLYSINTNGNIETKNDTIKDFIFGCKELLNASILPMPDNSFIISGVWNAFLSGTNSASNDTRIYIIKHSQFQQREWSQYLAFCFTCPYSVTVPSDPSGASSVIQTNTGQYLFQFAFNADENGTDNHSILTGLLNADGVPDTSFIYSTGIYNRYCNGFIPDYFGDYIYHYSSPRFGGHSSQPVPAGFLRIGQDAEIKDTIPLSIPSDHRIVSCTKGNSGFLLTTYKVGVANGGSDYTGEHTLFLRGGTDWRATQKYTFQEFYSDFFFSHAPVSDGGFISLGRIQSFNGPVNKLMLVRWE